MLLDDPSPSVRTAVLAEIKRLGDSGVHWLEEVAADECSPYALAAESYLESMAVPGVMAAMRRFIRSQNCDLETGAILLQRVMHPRLEASRISASIDAIARRAQELIATPSTPAMVVRALNRVIYHELGYRGEPDRNPDPGTVLLGDLLALRRGIPLSMSIFYLLAAKRLGLEFEPVILPNRILLGYLRDREPFLVDPYARGRFFTWAEAQSLVPIQGLLALQRLWPHPSGDLLRKLCERLSEIYLKRDEADKAEVFGGFVRDFEETSRRSEAV